MNGKDSQASGSSNRLNNDDGYDDDGSGIEDDAPESFQSLGGSESPWATFPDLLRVQTSSANAATEDDSPESFSFAAHPFRSNGNEASGGNASTGEQDGLSFRFRATANPSTGPAEIGAIPKNRRVLAPPDVSQIDASNPPSNPSRFQASMRGSNLLGNNGSQGLRGPEVTIANHLPSSSSSNPNQWNSSYIQHNSDNSNRHNQDRNANHHRNPVNSLNLSSALYSSQPSAPSSSTLSLSLAPIASTLARVQASIDNLTKQVNERLDSLESRLNSLAMAVGDGGSLAPSSSSSNLTENGSSQINPTLSNATSNQMKMFIREQRKELSDERKSFLLIFAEAIRHAAESVNQPSADDSTSGINGPRL